MAKFCGNCGAKMSDEANICGMCGTRFAGAHSPPERPVNQTSNKDVTEESVLFKPTSGKPENKKQLIVSLLAVLNVMFSPIYDVWGGLFPSKPDSNFWDVISGHCEPNEWVFVLTIAIAIPSALMFIFALAKKQKAAKVSGWIGIISVGFMIINFINQFDFSDLFDFDDGNLCFGFWIGLILFIIMAFSSKKKRQKMI